MLSEEKEVLEYIKESFSLRSQKLYKPAVEMLYKALNLDNDNIEVLYQLAELYYLMHNNGRALGYLQDILDKSKNHIETLKLIQRINQEEGKYSKALKYAQQVFNIEKNSDNLKNIIRLCSKMKKIDELKDYKSCEFCNCEVIYEIANAYYENSLLDLAKSTIIESSFQNDELKVLLGKIYFEEQNLEKSREIFSQFPPTIENAQILNYKGLFALEDMNFIEAIKFFSKATSINKNNHVYFYNLGNAYFFNGWMEEAQKAYSKAIYLAPDNMDYRYSLCYLHYETDKLDKCTQEVDAILSTMPEHAQTKVLKALLLDKNKDYGSAKTILEKCAKTNNDEFTLLSLAKVYTHLDMFAKAEKTIQKIIKKSPDNLDYISDLTDVYIKEKLFDKAIELIEKTINSNPNYIYGYILGAKASYLKEDFEATKQYSQQALSLDINCSEGYYYLALVRYNEKDFEEAIECMKRAITYDVNNAKYYAQMSEIYKANKDYKTALDYIAEAENIDNSTEYKLMYKELASLNRKS